MVTQTQETCCTCLAIASVPMQEWRQPLSPEAAFKSGTIFSELVLPYNPPKERAAAALQGRVKR